jgi:hypothetical protein
VEVRVTRVGGFDVLLGVGTTNAMSKPRMDLVVKE